MRLKDRVAIVTGAGRGIGKGIAQVFAEEGATVIVASLGEAAGRETEREITSAGYQALYITTDVASEASICTLMEQVDKQFGKLDILVNNAGITLFRPLLEATTEDWEKVMNVDLRGVFLCSKYAATLMMRERKGSIINISSNHAVSTLPDTEIYAAAKAGVNGMTRSMALSLGPYGIRVNAICPGFTDTPHYRQWLNQRENPDNIEREVHKLQAVGRISDPQDIGKLAAYLASDDSRMMTGAELLLDGGLSARLYYSDLC